MCFNGKLLVHLKFKLVFAKYENISQYSLNKYLVLPFPNLYFILSKLEQSLIKSLVV